MRGSRLSSTRSVQELAMEWPRIGAIPQPLPREIDADAEDKARRSVSPGWTDDQSRAAQESKAIEYNSWLNEAASARQGAPNVPEENDDFVRSQAGTGDYDALRQTSERIEEFDRKAESKDRWEQASNEVTGSKYDQALQLQQDADSQQQSASQDQSRGLS